MRHNFTLLIVISLFVISCTPRSYLLNESYFSAAKSENAPKSEKIETPNSGFVATNVVENKTDATSNAKLERDHVSITTLDPFIEEGSDDIEIYLEDLSEDFAYPIYGRFSSPYGNGNGRFHSGVDIAAPASSPIYAAFSGTVRLSKSYGEYGNTIVIQHDNGLETVYAHAAKNLVKVGDDVECGDEIARCGKTGNATGNHLHFEVRAAGKTINPELLINKDTEGLQSGVLHLTRDSKANVTAELLSEGSVKSESNKSINVSKPVSKGVMIDGKLYDAPATKKKVEAEKIYHTVVSGDTLSQIAEKYNQGLSVVLKLNNMTRNDIIKVGQKLRIK